MQPLIMDGIAARDVSLGYIGCAERQEGFDGIGTIALLCLGGLFGCLLCAVVLLVGRLTIGRNQDDASHVSMGAE